MVLNKLGKAVLYTSLGAALTGCATSPTLDRNVRPEYLMPSDLSVRNQPHHSDKEAQQMLNFFSFMEGFYKTAQTLFPTKAEDQVLPSTGTIDSATEYQN